jgi:hypothetical protein
MHKMLNHRASPASTNIPSYPTGGNAKCVTLNARAPPLIAKIASKRIAFSIVWPGGSLTPELIA